MLPWSGLALHADAATHGFGKVFAQRQAQARTFDVATFGAQAFKRDEEPCDLRGIQAAAGVRDLKAQTPADARSPPSADPVAVRAERG